MLCFDKVSVSLCVALIVVGTKLTGQLRSLACSSCHKIQKNGGVSTVRGHEWPVAFVAAVIEEILPQLWYSLSTKFRNLKYCSNSTIRILEVTTLNDFYSSIKYISPGSIHIQSNWCILLQATSRMSLYYKLSITWHWFGKEHFLFFFPFCDLQSTVNEVSEVYVSAHFRFVSLYLKTVPICWYKKLSCHRRIFSYRVMIIASESVLNFCSGSVDSINLFVLEFIYGF